MRIHKAVCLIALVCLISGEGLGQAAMADRDTSVSELCTELGIKPVTLYRYVGPQGQLRPAEDPLAVKTGQGDPFSFSPVQ